MEFGALTLLLTVVEAPAGSANMTAERTSCRRCETVRDRTRMHCFGCRERPGGWGRRREGFIDRWGSDRGPHMCAIAFCRVVMCGCPFGFFLCIMRSE